MEQQRQRDGAATTAPVDAPRPAAGVTPIPTTEELGRMRVAVKERGAAASRAPTGGLREETVHKITASPGQVRLAALEHTACELVLLISGISCLTELL